jgi:hypothetical protein
MTDLPQLDLACVACAEEGPDVQLRTGAEGGPPLCDACWATALQWDLLQHRVQRTVFENEALALASKNQPRSWSWRSLIPAFAFTPKL